MPILEVEVVESDSAPLPKGAAQSLADAAGATLGTESGRTWVRLRHLARKDYAENGSTLADDLAPVFVRVLEFQPPTAAKLDEQSLALAKAIAEALGRESDQVHLLYEPPAKGRIAFGGRVRR